MKCHRFDTLNTHWYVVCVCTLFLSFSHSSSSFFVNALLWNKCYRLRSIVPIVSAANFQYVSFESHKRRQKNSSTQNKVFPFKHFLHLANWPGFSSSYVSLSPFFPFLMTMVITTIQSFSITTHSIVPFQLTLVIIVIISLVRIFCRCFAVVIIGPNRLQSDW